jgi:hypothetical protein
MVEPIRRVNVDFTAGMLRELGDAAEGTEHQPPSGDQDSGPTRLGPTLLEQSAKPESQPELSQLHPSEEYAQTCSFCGGINDATTQRIPNQLSKRRFRRAPVDGPAREQRTDGGSVQVACDPVERQLAGTRPGLAAEAQRMVTKRRYLMDVDKCFYIRRARSLARPARGPR